MLLDPRESLENMYHKTINRLVFAQRNVNSLRNKFDSLQHIINKNIYAQMIRLDSFCNSDHKSVTKDPDFEKCIEL